MEKKRVKEKDGGRELRKETNLLFATLTFSETQAPAATSTFYEMFRVHS